MTTVITRDIKIGSKLPADGRISAIDFDKEAAQVVIERFNASGGYLKGEIGQPRRQSGISDEAYVLRVNEIQESNIGVILETTGINEKDGEEYLQIKGTLTEEALLVFPDTDILKLGCRMFTNGNSLQHFVTFDLVTKTTY